MRLLRLRLLRQQGQSHEREGKTPYAYYRCVGTDAYRFGGQRVCQNKQVRTDKLDEAVWQDVASCYDIRSYCGKEYERRLASPTDSGTQHR